MSKVVCPGCKKLMARRGAGQHKCQVTERKVECPCCHELLSQRSVNRHLASLEHPLPAGQRGESDDAAEQAGEATDPSDLEGESDDADDARRRALSVSAARRALDAGLSAAAAYVTIATITILMLAMHTRFNLTETCMSVIGELVALAAPGLTSACNPSKLFAQFKSLWTPEVVNIHLCPAECVAFVGSLSSATHCPRCNESRTDQHGKPRHVRHVVRAPASLVRARCAQRFHSAKVSKDSWHARLSASTSSTRSTCPTQV